jgi:SAM-dependent methyltransferase
MTSPDAPHGWLQFSTVDESGDVDAHARYLERLARWFAEARERSLESLDLRRGVSFLDAGCGLGELAISVSGRLAPGRVVGIDVSAELIARAVADAEVLDVGVEFMTGSVTALPFDDASFDVVRSERVFQHLTAGERSAAATELMRVLRPGGRVQLVDPDHGQWSVAATDRRLARLVAEWVSNSVRTPAAGILNAALLHDAGAVDIEIDADAVRIRGYEDWVALLGLEGMTDQLIADGLATASEIDAFQRDLRSRDESGTFIATVVTYIVTGRRA